MHMWARRTGSRGRHSAGSREGAGKRHTAAVEIRLARQQDVAQLAELLWLHAAPHEQDIQCVEAFVSDLRVWWARHDDSHLAFVAGGPELVGMAWLALVPRVPRPGSMARFSADIQSVFVLPEHRGRGVGSALIKRATEHALDLGVGRVTVHSGRKAVPVYERLGFASSSQLLELRSE